MFKRHMLNDKGIEAIDEFKSEFAQLTESQMNKMENGRTKSVFMTKMEDAIFWGTKALAEKTDNHSEVISYGNQSE